MSGLLWIIILGGIIYLISNIRSDKSKTETKYDYNEWFNKALENADNALDFLSKMQNDTDLCSFVASQTGAVLRFNGKTITSPKEKLKLLMTMDLVKCYTIMGYRPSSSDKRSIPMFMFYSKLTDSKTDITIDNIEDYRDNTRESFNKIMEQHVKSVMNSSDVFFVAEYLKHNNKELLSEYVRTLLSFGYSVAGAKGKVSQKDDDALDRIFNLREA